MPTNRLARPMQEMHERGHPRPMGRRVVAQRRPTSDDRHPQSPLVDDETLTHPVNADFTVVRRRSVSDTGDVHQAETAQPVPATFGAVIRRTGRPETVQRVAYRSTDAARTDRVTVEEAGDRLVLSGRVTDRDGVVKDVSGSVNLSETQVAQHKVVAGGDPGVTVGALRVFALEATPRGLKLGQLLTYHHGLVARDRGIDWVVAMDVSGAGGPFYLPLGFQDFLGGESWQALTNENAGLVALVGKLAGMQTPGGEESIAELLARQAAVTAQLAAAGMFIATARLIENSLKAINGRWRAE